MTKSPAAALFQSHPRTFQANRYVYPVLSRRAGGISVGVNITLDKVCNFHCVYCQVDRKEPAQRELVDLRRLREELDETIELAASGRIFQDMPFRDVPPSLRRLNDIALSGNAEPTTCPNFADVVSVCAEVRQRHALNDLKLVLITNATMLQRPAVVQALEVLDANNGEIWGKLDAGTEAYYQQVARSAVPLQQILDNLLAAARVRPIVIQSLFMQLGGQPPPAVELEAYCTRLHDLSAAGGQIKLVQVYTVARTPAELWVTPLSDREMDAIAQLVRTRTNLPAAAFYSTGSAAQPA